MAIGAVNTLLASDGTLPGWTNNININSVTTNDLIINNSVQGDILFVDNNQINGLAIGANNYVLQSNNSSPQWTNDLTLNTITLNDLKINGTVQNDILTIDSNQFIERIPIGPLGSILTSYGTSLQYALYSDGRALFYGNQLQSEMAQTFSANQINLTANVRTTYINTNFTVYNGRKYKVSFYCFIQQAGSSTFFVTTNLTEKLFSSTGNQTLNWKYIYTANATGLINFKLEAVTTDFVNNILFDPLVLFEPF